MPVLKGVEDFMDNVKQVLERIMDMSKPLRESEWFIFFFSIEYSDRNYISNRITEEIQTTSGSNASNNCLLQKNESISQFVDEFMKHIEDCASKLFAKINEIKSSQRNLLLTTLEISDTVEESPRKCLNKSKEKEFPRCVNNTLVFGDKKLSEINKKLDFLSSEVGFSVILERACSRDEMMKWGNKQDTIINEVKQCLKDN